MGLGLEGWGYSPSLTFSSTKTYFVAVSGPSRSDFGVGRVAAFITSSSDCDQAFPLAGYQVRRPSLSFVERKTGKGHCRYVL